MKFSQKILKIGGVENLSFFVLAMLFFFITKKNSFALSLFKMLTFYVIPRMGQYFDDYPDFQQKVKGV